MSFVDPWYIALHVYYIGKLPYCHSKKPVRLVCLYQKAAIFHLSVKTKNRGYHTFVYIHVPYCLYFLYKLHHIFHSTDSRREVVKNVHWVLVDRIVGLSLSRKSVVRLTDHPDMTIAVYHGHVKQQHTNLQHLLFQVCAFHLLRYNPCVTIA